MAEVIYRVFISSTYEDLREERAEVQKALLKLRCLPVGMELFPSADEETWDFIKKQIEASDYYIVVVAGRYGSTGPDGTSFTEMEYDYARSIGKPALRFVHANPGSIPASKSEIDQGRRERLENFIRKFKDVPTNRFSNPHELGSLVVTSFIDLRETKPAVGFIRADQSIDPKKYADALEENARLRADLQALQLETATQLFSGAGDQIPISYGERYEKEKNKLTRTTTTMATVFSAVAESIAIGETTEWYIGRTIANKLAGLGGQADSKLCVEAASLAEIKVSLFRLGLIDTTMEQRQGSDRAHSVLVWKLTPFGRTQYKLLD